MTDINSMSAEDSVNVHDTIICLIDEYSSGKKLAFDCHVLLKNAKGVDVVYLSGYKSRNDFVEWPDILAKVDKSLPVVGLGNHGFSGHFNVFI